MTVEEIEDINPEALLCDGFDEAIIGIATDFTTPRIIYSVTKCIEILMKDENRQDRTVRQYIKITAPQKNNKVRGPHFHLFQEVRSGPGLVMLRVGGNYVISTYDNKYEIIGEDPKNPSDKIEIITKKIANIFFLFN